MRLRLTLASDCSDATLTGSVTLRHPVGWDQDSATRMWAPGRHREGTFEIPPRAYREAEVTVRVPDDAAPATIPSAPN